MADSDFLYAKCPLKHHIRRTGWLPLCARRRKLIRKGRKASQIRELRYFTFCAIDAIDVLMLDLAQIIGPTDGATFDSVYFFNRSDEAVLETRKNIPGATGFPGDFVDVVLVEDEEAARRLSEEGVEGVAEELEDTQETRSELALLRTHTDFRNSFPFDVINLDLEGYLFKKRDKIPGRMVNAFRKIFEWQQLPLATRRGPEYLDGFSLMFTTRVGPTNMGDDLRDMLRSSLLVNIEREPALGATLTARTGADDVDALIGDDFEVFFKLAAPKILAQVLMESDWYIDPTVGVEIFQIERTPEGYEPYRILHLTMDVKRHSPPKQQRAPGAESQLALDGYREVVRRLFVDPETVVTLASVDERMLGEDLEVIEAQRQRYLGGT